MRRAGEWCEKRTDRLPEDGRIGGLRERRGAGLHVGSVPPIAYLVRSSGQPLDSATRSLMERRFGHDFSKMRVHADEEAGESARAMNALAYTPGHDVIFGRGNYSPFTARGRKLLAHELAHVCQQEDQSPSAAIEGHDSSAEQEAERVGWRVGLGLSPGPVSQSRAAVALTAASDAIKPLISYSAIDWEVTTEEEIKVVTELDSDPDVSATVTDLNKDGMLEALINRVDDDTNRRNLVQILGSKTNAAARALVEPYVAKLDAKWQLQFNLGRLGVTSAAPAFNAAPFAGLISSDPSKPFTGSGATGINPTTLSISTWDQAALAAKSAATVQEYSNPISDRPPGDLAAYLSGLSASDRSQQAELLLKQQISSVKADSYAGKIPSRAQVVAAASKLHKLKPQHLAAFLLAEQRDQSKNEDAKDYLGATSRIFQGNTSIGLGQVVVSTAQKNDLFQDLLSPGTTKGLSHNDVATLLASDEFNIFAAARYIRKVADDGSKVSIATLPNTKAAFPGIDMPAFANDSSTWPDDNLRALASEYTSTAWDDSLSEGWAFFVYEAYKDVVGSGVSF
jgi:type VI secretion system (T6SS) peptidoglycan muramidase Tse3-like protein/uncharacterized protein DUF4157